MRTLIVAPAWIGDAVLSHPLLVRLKARFPESAIDVLAPAWVLPVYRHMPEVAETFDAPFGHGRIALGARWRVARMLAARGYRRAFVLPNSFKSALVPWMAGIAERVGYVGEMRHGLLTDARRLDTAALPLMAERFAWLAQGREDPLLRPLADPRLRVDHGAREARLEALGLQRPARLACFCPGAEYGPAKRWPERHYADLARRLDAEGYAVWLLGSPKDAPVGDSIAQSSGGIARNLCGATTLTDAILLLSMADLVVTNDSGLMHVAAAFDRPMVAIYGSSSPGFTPPLSGAARVVKLDLPCSPCFERVCPLKHFNCMIELTPERVHAWIRELGASA
jgi:heptosyltransferase II